MENLKPLSVELRKGERYQRLLAGLPQSSGMKSGHVTLKPGESIGEHSTEAREESLIIIEGEAEVHFAQDPSIRVNAESLVFIPKQTVHDVKNVGRSTLRYVFVVSPVPA